MNDRILEIMKRTVIAAGRRIMRHYGNLRDLDISRKNPIDMVTVADTESEKWIRNRLSRIFPGSGFIGEETGSGNCESDLVFILDPIDGTTNFIHSVPLFCTSLACMEKGKIAAGVVYNPATCTLFSTVAGNGAFCNRKKIRVSQVSELKDALAVTGFACVRSGCKPDNIPAFNRMIYETGGVRRTGSAALDLCSVANGQMDCFWELNLNIWDVAAGILIVREAGGKVTDYSGGSDPVGARELCATNGILHDKFLQIIKNS